MAKNRTRIGWRVDNELHSRRLGYDATLSPDSRSGSQPELPSAVQRFLLDIVADGFVVYYCGDRAAPTALVASYEWDHYIDLVTIGELRASSPSQAMSWQKTRYHSRNATAGDHARRPRPQRSRRSPLWMTGSAPTVVGGLPLIAGGVSDEV